MADAGHYTCSATNAVGQRNSSSTVELKVNQGMLIMFAKSIQACLIPCKYPFPLKSFHF
jgi:hypothetical protein